MSDVKFAVFGHLRMFSKKPKIFTERYQLRAAPPYGKDTKNKLTKKKGHEAFDDNSILRPFAVSLRQVPLGV